jgi:hypothetical protein
MTGHQGSPNGRAPYPAFREMYPEYVPLQPTSRPRIEWRSPARRRGPWVAERPGDIERRGQPQQAGFGVQGPDQGYALKLMRSLGSELRLEDAEDLRDVEAGCAQVALKRASIYRRAPVIHDVTAAAIIWGFRDRPADDELVAFRRSCFSGAHEPHAYATRQAIGDAVLTSALSHDPGWIATRHHEDWRSPFDPVRIALHAPEAGEGPRFGTGAPG